MSMLVRPATEHRVARSICIGRLSTIVSMRVIFMGGG